MDTGRTIKRLEDIITYSEREFLSVGETLHELDRQIDDIGKEADYLKQSIQETLCDNREQILDSLFPENSSKTAFTQNIEDCMERIGTLLADDQAYLQKMISQIKGMQKTDLVVRVELAHHENLAEGYASLARQVSDLASEIKRKSQTLLTASTRMNSLIRSSRTTIHTLYRSISRLYARLIEKGHNRLLQIDKRREAAQTLAHSLSEEGILLHEHLHAMVSRLQMHDIIRQKIQQAVALLRDHSPDPPPPDQRSRLVVSLEESNDSFIEVIENIRLQLISVNSRLSALQKDCRSLMTGKSQSPFHGSTQSKSHDIFQLNDLVAVTREFVKSETDLNGFIENLSTGIMENRQILQDILSLGTDMELYSQNAAVTAGFTQGIASSLIVLAEQTQRDISALQNTLSSILSTKNRLETEAGILSGFYREYSDDMEKLIETMADLDERISPIERIQNNRTERIEKLNERLERIIDTVTRLTDSFHSDQDHATTISEAIHLLAGASFLPGEINPDKGGLSNEIDSQRSGIEAKTQRKLVENKDNHSPSSTDKPENEFGEDVELF